MSEIEIGNMARTELVRFRILKLWPGRNWLDFELSNLWPGRNWLDLDISNCGQDETGSIANFSNYEI